MNQVIFRDAYIPLELQDLLEAVHWVYMCLYDLGMGEGAASQFSFSRKYSVSYCFSFSHI